MKRKFSNKTAALLVSLLVLAGAAIGGTIAWITAQTPAVVNEFDPAEVTTQVSEELAENVKSNVKIKNTGDIDAYIRAAVAINWKDANGNISSDVPKACGILGCTHESCGNDYVISYNLTEGWIPGADGFYYWTKPVKSVEQDANNCYTGVLITNCKQLRSNGEYTLNVEILGSGIQSVPARVVETMWGGENNSKVNITVDNSKTLTVTPKPVQGGG